MRKIKNMFTGKSNVATRPFNKITSKLFLLLFALTFIAASCDKDKDNGTDDKKEDSCKSVKAEAKGLLDKCMENSKFAREYNEAITAGATVEQAIEYAVGGNSGLQAVKDYKKFLEENAECLSVTTKSGTFNVVLK